MQANSSHAWQSLYPPLQSHDHGWLGVDGGHRLYWEESGNPRGVPALFVHGGPGAGCSPEDRRWFDPSRYRIILLDQRGAGRSQPLGGLFFNDTPHLVADMEALRRHLRVAKWLLLGGSWGATLALAYAQRHPQHVLAIVLRGVFTATPRELQWLYGPTGAATIDPAAWERLVETVPGAQAGHLLRDTEAQLHSGDALREHAAAAAWLRWEQDLMNDEVPASMTRAGNRDLQGNPAAALAIARIGVHYARRSFFLDDGQLLTQASRLGTTPGIIVQGMRDLVTPPAAARSLHQVWPGSRLHEVETAGHSSRHPVMAQRLVEATDFFGDMKTLTATSHERLEYER